MKPCSCLPAFKEFFKNLSAKEKFSFFARLFFTVLCLAEITFLHEKVGIQTEKIFISVFCLLTACAVFGRIAFLFIHVPIFILGIVDWHLYRMYGLSLFSIGTQITGLLLDTNKTEVVEYLSKISFSEWIALGSVVALSVACWFYKPPFAVHKIVYVMIFLIFPFSYMEHMMPALYYHFFKDEDKVLAQAKTFKFEPQQNEQQASTVVILVGESHRYQEFAPAFAKYAKQFNTLYQFNDLISSHAGTMDAVPMILSRKKFTDKQKFFPEKSVFSLFQEAGYTTYFLHYTDNAKERNNLSFIYNEARHFINFHPETTGLHDGRIGQTLDDIFKSDTGKKLIVVKMMGVHETFESRYPPEYDTRHPSLKKNVHQKDDGVWQTIVKWLKDYAAILNSAYQREKGNQEAVLNTYQNAIDYSAKIVADITGQIKNRPEPALLMFSSDHGICIYDKGTLHLPPNCQNAFHIPAMIYLNPALEKQTPADKKKNLACNIPQALTQEYLFETVASLAGIVYPKADKTYDLTTRCAPLKGQKRPVDTLRRDKQDYYEDI